MYVEIFFILYINYNPLGAYSIPPPKILTLKDGLRYTILTTENESPYGTTSSSTTPTNHVMEKVSIPLVHPMF